MRPRVDEMLDYCTLEVAMTVCGGVWKLSILKYLFTGTLRFGELNRAMPDITPRMLTRQLRDLEEDGAPCCGPSTARFRPGWSIR